MPKNVKKLLFLLFSLTFLVFVAGSNFIFGQTVDQQKLDELNKQIAEYEAQISKLSSQANTLSNQIAQYDAQIKLTTLKISQTEEKISLLGGRIIQLETSLNALSDAFASRAIETYKVSRLHEPFFMLITSPNLASAFSSFHYLQKIQASDHDLLVRLGNAQGTYKDEKSSQEQLQKELQRQQKVLDSQKAAKNNLLTQTKNDEKRYQQLLSEAKAQLSALSNFARSMGGGIIPHQEISDTWGKYYNQRDSNWGNMLIGVSNEQVWEVGCLLTSYAMVVNHFGGSLTPADVASNSSFFSPYKGTEALFLSPGPSANGHSVIAVSNPSLESLRNALNSGSVVIAGLSANGGPYPTHYSDHWVVLRSVDGNTFKINDPWYAGAMNVSLNDHYSGWTIIQARIYN